MRPVAIPLLNMVFGVLVGKVTIPVVIDSIEHNDQLPVPGLVPARVYCRRDVIIRHDVPYSIGPGMHRQLTSRFSRA
jgi:hypothetical protein